MSITNKTYSIGKIKQLIDLNGDSINFDIQFKVTSKNKEPFDMLVVDQTTLDNNPTLEYKKVDKGEISGNIVHDKNIYQNYFIILKADNLCECNVEIIKKELPKTAIVESLPSKSIVDKTNNNFNWINIILIAGVVIILVVSIYMFYWRTSTTSDNMLDSPRNSVRELQIDSPRMLSPNVVTPRVATPRVDAIYVAKNSLLDKLKNLKI